MMQRTPLITVMFLASLGLFAACFYLIARTVKMHNTYENDVEHTCSPGTPTDYYMEIVKGGVNVVYNVPVNITGPSDPLIGNVGKCDVAVACNNWYFVNSVLVCTSSEPIPTSLTCWTEEDTTTPVCDRPGSDWIGSMVGCIVCGIFGIAFILIGLALRRTMQNAARGVYDTTRGAVYVEQNPPSGGRPVVAVVGQPIQVPMVQMVPPVSQERQVVQAVNGMEYNNQVQIN
jgi:hypothetical protein